MNKVLMIIDPQIDFITGILPVIGAVDAMNALAGYISAHGGDYRHIIVTADRHPYNHQSFKEYGGEWPRHCVHDTVGAAVWQPVMEALYAHGQYTSFFHKGECASVEEYSIFKNLYARKEIENIVRSVSAERIDICGLAGDVCVADSIRDGIEIFGAEMFNVLKEFSPSIDGGGILSNLIRSYGLKRQ